MNRSIVALLTIFSTAIACHSALAQQITGVPGSPSATTTIDGNQLPPPPPPFGGVIKQDAKDSKPWWPPTRGAAEGRAERAADHDRRPGYGVSEHLRRRDPDARRSTASPRPGCATRSSTRPRCARRRARR